MLDDAGAYMRVVFEHQGGFLCLRTFAVLRELKSHKQVFCRTWSLVGVVDDEQEHELLGIDLEDR